VKVLFDHNVPKRLRQSLPGHEVRTAQEMGWSELENGEILNAAQAAGFHVVLTCDQNLSYQQNLTGRAVALVVLNTNYWPALKENTAPVIQAVNSAAPGTFQMITIKSRRS